MLNLFNGYRSSPCKTSISHPLLRGFVKVSDGVTVTSVPEERDPFPTDLTADAFSLKSLSASGVPIRPTNDGLIPATPEQRLLSAYKFGYDLNARYNREVAEANAKAASAESNSNNSTNSKSE